MSQTRSPKPAAPSTPVQKLKAERVELQQPAGPATPVQKLKAERVELKLARLPGWEASPDRTQLSREFELASRTQAAHLAKQAVDWAVRRRGEPWFSLSQRRFQVRLSTPAAGGLTQADFDFARKLSEWVEWMEQGGKTEKAASR